MRLAWNKLQAEKQKEWDAPLEYKLDPSQWLEWEYARPEGDITVFAPTRDEAVRVMAENGFTNVDPEKVTKRDRLLADVLMKEAL